METPAQINWSAFIVLLAFLAGLTGMGFYLSLTILAALQLPHPRRAAKKPGYREEYPAYGLGLGGSDPSPD